ncbi:MAG: hypothetical protein SFX73_07400 [Kofleriaceae bacterium]|nr:hypothetical protein [Kofleriaceae bacterium]
MIWEPFVLALFLGLIVSAGLYFAYLWPHVEPTEEDSQATEDAGGTSPPAVTDSSDGAASSASA